MLLMMTLTMMAITLTIMFNEIVIVKKNPPGSRGIFFAIRVTCDRVFVKVLRDELRGDTFF